MTARGFAADISALDTYFRVTVGAIHADITGTAQSIDPTSASAALLAIEPGALANVPAMKQFLAVYRTAHFNLHRALATTAQNVSDARNAGLAIAKHYAELESVTSASFKKSGS
jgi:hypothetical protein